MEQWIWLKYRCEFIELMALTAVGISVYGSLQSSVLDGIRTWNLNRVQGLAL